MEMIYVLTVYGREQIKTVEAFCETSGLGVFDGDFEEGEYQEFCFLNEHECLKSKNFCENNHINFEYGDYSEDYDDD